MAYQVELYDGTTNHVFINATPGIGNPELYLEDGGLDIGNPKKTEAFSPAILGDIPVSREYGNRQVTITFSVRSSTIDYIGDALHDLHTTLNKAWDYWTKGPSGARVQLKVKWNPGGGFENYFAVVAGQVYLPGNFLSLENAVTKYGDGDYVLKGCKLVLSCLPRIFRQSWISSSLYDAALVPLDNAETATRTIQASVAASHTYWTGDVESPITIEIENMDSTTTYDYTRFIVGVGTYQSARDYNDYVYEGEDGSAFGYSATSTPSDSSMSGGAYRELTISSASWGDAGITWHSLSGRQIPIGTFKAIARFQAAVNTDTQYKLVLRYYNEAHKIVEGEEIGPLDSSTYVLDLGTFTNPPEFDPFIASDTPAVLLPILYMRTTTGTSKTIYFDSLYFIHQEIGYRVYEFPTKPLVYQWKMVDQTWQGPNAVYLEDASGNQYTGYVRALYSPIFCTPEQDTVFQVLAQDTTGKMRVDDNKYRIRVSQPLSYVNPRF